MRRLALLCVVVVGVACSKRQATPEERTQIAQWQSMVVAVRDAGALSALRTRAQAGSVEAQSALGQALITLADAGSQREGFDWLMRAARSGDARAEFSLGKLHFMGRGTIQQSFAVARKHFLVASQTDPRASYYLGLMSKGGYGTAPDDAAAARHFDVAAQAGIPAAMFLLANAFKEGIGVKPNPKRALELYEAAADKDHPESIQALALAYRDGDLGLQRDPARYEAQLAELAHSLRHPPALP